MTTVRIAQRVYINGFPKSGLHLAEQFIRQIAAPVEGLPWLGNVAGAWTGDPTNMDRFSLVFPQIPAGAYVKGHCTYHPEIAEALWDNGIVTLFIWRDLRDVAVSAAHHVLDTRQAKDGDWLKHPGKRIYQGMDSFEDVLLAMISGVDRYPGVVDRWRQYKGWLDEKWVLSVSFEQLRYAAYDTAELIARYVLGQSAYFCGQHVTINRIDLNAIIANMTTAAEKRQTVTMRSGESGGYLSHWTDRVDAAFAAAGGYDEMEELGHVPLLASV